MKHLRWIFWILAVIFVWLVVSRFTELEKLLQTLAGGRWQWVVVAAALQLAYYSTYSLLYQCAFDTVEVRSRARDLLPVMFASVFMNLAAPMGGTSGSMLFIDDARRRGESPGRAAAGALLVLAADFSAFLVILVAGMVYLFVVHTLKLYEVISAIILLVLIGGMVAVLVSGLWRPDLLHLWMRSVQNIANRIGAVFGKPALLAENWATKNAAEYIEASLAISARPQLLGRTLGVAFLAHVVDLLSLLAVFLAFHQAVSIGVLVAGYAMMILFWIVSITPQGVGVVEGVMPLVFTSLGVPANQAVVITLAFRGLTFWIPFLIGFVLLRRLRMFNPLAKPAMDTGSLRLVALLTAIMGIINVLSAITPGLPERLAFLKQISPLEVVHGGRFTAALAGFALLLLANQLRRRKQTAWYLAVITLGISAVSHLLKGLNYEEAVLAAGLAGWLIYLRPHFHARSDVASIRQGVRVLLAATLFTLAYGAGGFYLLDRQFKTRFSLEAALRQTILMFTRFYDPGLQPVTGLGKYFADSIYLIGLATFSYAAVQLVRPVLIRRPATPQEQKQARKVVTTYGRSPLAPLALLPDKTYFITPGGSLIQYTVRGRTALSLGDPIGPVQDLPDAIQSFKAICDRNDWLPSFVDVLPDNLEAYRSASFQMLPIGEEAIVDLPSFTLEGGQNKGLRTAYHKLERLGYQAEVVEPPLSGSLLAELHEISDAWLTLVHGSEKRFWVGWFTEEYIGACRVMVVRERGGFGMAFANILPEYQKNDVTIDLMRHRPEAENGVMDYLFVSLIQWAKVQGYESFDMGLSALSGTGQTAEDPVIERTLNYIYEHINQFFNFKGLHAFKQKYHPRWEPRYLVYPSLAALPAIALALIRADSQGSLFESPP